MSLSPLASGWTASGPGDRDHRQPAAGPGTTLTIVLRVAAASRAEPDQLRRDQCGQRQRRGLDAGQQQPEHSRRAAAALEDNQINENGQNGNDEDDHDPATVNVGQVYDLALRKALAAGQPATVQAGDDVTFTLEVFNQGTLDASNVAVVDYIPAGMSLSPLASGWTDGGATATRTIASLPAGGSTTLTIVLRIAASFQGASLTNYAEISADNGNDADSTPDSSNQNTVGEQPPALEDNQINENGQNGNDEDDHDLATVNVEQVLRPGPAQDGGAAQTARGAWSRAR